METVIGPYDANTRTVPVTFTLGEVIHSRDVNAVLNEDGSYDRTATAARVEDVARGVEVKIGLGVIRMPDSELQVPEDEPAA